MKGANSKRAIVERSTLLLEFKSSKVNIFPFTFEDAMARHRACRVGRGRAEDNVSPVQQPSGVLREQSSSLRARRSIQFSGRLIPDESLHVIRRNTSGRQLSILFLVSLMRTMS